MKNLKTFILAIALIAGVSGAFATKASHSSSKNLVDYTWTRSAGTPIPGEQDPFVGDVQDAQLNFGCAGSNGLCATGSPIGGGLNVTLEFN